MVFVPADSYIVGTDQPNIKNPKRKCTVPAFFIDRYPVTNGRWREFRPDHRYPKELETHPVTNIHFIDAVLYARWRGKRLLTEVEWEAAARGQMARSTRGAKHQIPNASTAPSTS